MTHPDYWYDKWKNSSSANSCIVRVTNQCNEKCTHCAFRSGPECVGQMSVKTCEEINKWVPYRVVLNIMGGEFTILDNYPAMLLALSEGRNHIRLVTNGLWSHTIGRTEKFLQTLEQLVVKCSCADVAVSNDDWHMLSSNHAIELMEDYHQDIGINFIKTGNIPKRNLTPVGRAWDNHVVPSPQTHASCQVMSNMIITEDGMIGRCPYGYMPWRHFSETSWHEAQDYVWGWRSEKLAEGMNCHLCMKTVEASRCRGAEIAAS